MELSPIASSRQSDIVSGNNGTHDRISTFNAMIDPNSQHRETTTPIASHDPNGTSSSTRLVKLIITPDHLAVLDPPVPSLEELLEYRQRTFRSGGPHGYQEIVQELAIWQLDIKGRFTFPAGLLTRVTEHLDAEGYEIQIEDQRIKARKLRPNLMMVDCTQASDCKRLSAIGKHLLGQIEVTSRDDAVELCATIAEFYQDATVLIAVPTRKQAHRIWSELREQLNEKVGLWAAGVSRKQCRCAVTTIGSMHTATDWDILVLPVADQTIGDEAAYKITRLGFGRRYAFIQTGKHLDSLAQVRLEMMAGPIISRVAGQKLQVLAAMLSTPTSKVGKAQTALSQKRKLYWTNQSRNEYIARIAATIASRPRQTLRQLFGRTVTLAMLAGDNKLRVAVLVESAEHARELARLLPDWKLRTWTDEARRGLPGNLQAQHTILTSAYAARIGTDAQVVIRATGTSDPLHVRDFPPKAVDTNETHVLVIDFADEFHPLAAVKAKHRRRSYERQDVLLSVKEIELNETNSIIPGPYDASHQIPGGVRDSRSSSQDRTPTLIPAPIRFSGGRIARRTPPSIQTTPPWDESTTDEDVPQ
jgi:hypothetical protein